jgi:hypothetical protein
MVEERIKNYVNKKDKESLYLILSDYLKESFERFDENIKYVEKNLDIFQVYDGTPFEQNKEKWNKDYLFLEKGRLISNFSKERVEHIKKIIRKLYPERNKITTSYSSENTNRKISNDDTLPKVVIGTGAIIAGAGLLTLKISLIAVGAVVAVGGAVYKYNKR